MAKKENALNIKRIPDSEEFFNVGDQPKIPTRGLSTIISDKPKRKLFKITLEELMSNEFKHEV